MSAGDLSRLQKSCEAVAEIFFGMAKSLSYRRGVWVAATKRLGSDLVLFLQGILELEIHVEGSFLVFSAQVKMASNEAKEDKDALDALEVEAKEFDKVRSRQW